MEHRDRQEILRLKIIGLSNMEIAYQLWLPINTVNNVINKEDRDYYNKTGGCLLGYGRGLFKKGGL